MRSRFARGVLLRVLTIAIIGLAAYLTLVTMKMSNPSGYLLAQRLLLRPLALGIVGLAAAYLARVAMPRPPVGLFVRSDVYVMIITLVVMPFAYLAVPVVLVAALFGIVMFIAAQQTLAPLMGGRYAGVAVGLLCGANVITFAAGWEPGVLVANDLVIMIVVVGVTNLWTQTGMAPGHVAILAVALSGYDLLATGLSGFTADFTNRVIGLPFTPVLATHYDTLAPQMSVGIGLGDCLLLAVWPLVAAKTYGRAAGWSAAVIDVLVMGPGLVIMTRYLGGPSGIGVPLATPLGLLIVAQYLYWRRRARKATVAEPATMRPLLADSLRTLDSLADGPSAGTWVATHEGQIVATGTSPGAASRAARRTGLTAIPAIGLVHLAGRASPVSAERST